jgi:large subunit ribosomal protein L10
MNQAEKRQLVEEMRAEFAAAPNAVLLDFRGLSVPAATEFRRRVRKAGSRYRVVKNTLARRAVEGTPLAGLGPALDGITGIAYTGEDPVALAKVLVDFAKDHPQLVVKKGVVGGREVLDAEGVKALSALPGLPELRGRFLGLLQAPAARLVRLLNGPSSKLVRVLKAYEEKRGAEA